jgi:peptidoglycan/LPS O-acetylase OafA/YrhL
MNPTIDQSHSRLYFLDWVRIIAFFLLILYHVGMYYVSWDWHVKSPFASSTIEPLMMLSSPWRLSLLFLVSGVASAFMLQKISAAGFMKQRTFRLLLPLVFGMYAIVPLQPYFEVVEKVAYAGSFGDFMGLYLQGYGGFCRGDDCLDLPTWNHLWFVAYLWVYTLILGGLTLTMGKRLDRAAEWIGRHLTGWKLIVIPAAVLALFRTTMLTAFPSTHGLFDDFYNHANYLAVFLLGALMAQQTRVWAGMDDLRWAALGIALGCWAALIAYFSMAEANPALEAFRTVQRCVWSLCAWSAIVAAIGFARSLLNFDSAKRRYLADAVFPVYILHQTLIVTMAHLMKPAKLAAPLEGLILVVLTFALCFAGYEMIRRVALLRPLFGLKYGQPQISRGQGAPLSSTVLPSGSRI